MEPRPDIQTDRLDPVDTTFPSTNPSRTRATVIQSGYEDYTAEQFLAVEFLVYNLMAGTETMFVGSSENSLRFFEKAMDYGWKGTYCHCPPKNVSDKWDNGIILQHIFKDWLSGEKPMGALLGGTRFWRAIDVEKSSIILDVQLTPPRIDSYPCFQCSEKDGDFLYVSRFEGSRLQRLERIDQSWYAYWWRQKLLNQPLMPYNFPFPSCLMVEETVGMWDMTNRWQLSPDLISSGHCLINVKAVEDVCVTDLNTVAHRDQQGSTQIPRYAVDYYGRQLLSADGVQTHFIAANTVGIQTVASVKNKESNNNVQDFNDTSDQCTIISHSECAEIALEIFKSATNIGNSDSKPDLFTSTRSSPRTKNILKYLAPSVGRKNVASIVVLDVELFSRPVTQVDLRAAKNMNESMRDYIIKTIIPLLKLGCNTNRTTAGNQNLLLSDGQSTTTLFPDYHMALHKLCRSKRIIPRYGPLAMSNTVTMITQGSLQFLVCVFFAWLVGYTGIVTLFACSALLPYPGNFMERTFVLNIPYTPWTGKGILQFFISFIGSSWFLYWSGFPYLVFGWKGGLTQLQTITISTQDFDDTATTKDSDSTVTTQEMWVPIEDEYAYLTFFTYFFQGPMLFSIFVKKMVKDHNLPKYMLVKHDKYDSMVPLPFLLPMATLLFGNYLNTTFQSQLLTSTYISFGFSSMEALSIIFIEGILHKIQFEEIIKVEEDLDRTRGLRQQNTTLNYINTQYGAATESAELIQKLNPYPCGIDRLCDMPVQIPNPISESADADKELFRARRNYWMEERERFQASKKKDTSSASQTQSKVAIEPAASRDVSQIYANKRLSIQADRDLIESGFYGLNCHHVIFVHATYEMCRLYMLLNTVVKYPKGSLGIISSIILSTISNTINRLGIPRVLVITFFPESASKLTTVNKTLFLPTTFNKVHDTSKFGAGYCRFWVVAAILIARAILFEQKYDPYNEKYYRTYLDQDGEILEKDRLDPNQVDYGCFCWNGNVLNCLIWLLLFELLEDEIVGAIHNNQKLKTLSACVLGYCYDRHLAKWKDQLSYSDFDKLHHHRLYVKNTEGSVVVKKSDTSNISDISQAATSNFDFIASILKSIVSCSKFGREALTEYGNYAASPRCRHLRLYGTIRGGSAQCELFQHSIGPSAAILLILPALTWGFSEFFSDRPTYSNSGSFRVGEVLVAHSRLHENNILV